MIAHMVPIGSLNYGDQVRVGEDVLTFAGRKLSGFAPDEYTVTLLDGTGTPLGFLRFETDELERVRPDLVLDVQGDPA